MKIERKDFENKLFVMKSRMPKFLHSEIQIEQILYRMYLCKSCFEAMACEKCGCNPYDVLAEPVSCNEEKFPHFMSEQQWKDYKIQKNIEII